MRIVYAALLVCTSIIHFINAAHTGAHEQVRTVITAQGLAEVMLDMSRCARAQQDPVSQQIDFYREPPNGCPIKPLSLRIALSREECDLNDGIVPHIQSAVVYRAYIEPRTSVRVAYASWERFDDRIQNLVDQILRCVPRG